jgi:hypothetical protein
MSDEGASHPAPPAPPALFHESYAAIYSRLPPSQQREAVKRLTLCKFPLEPSEVSTENPRVLVCLQALLLTYERKKARATVGSKTRRKAEAEAKAEAKALSTVVDDEPALALALALAEAEAEEPLPPSSEVVKQAAKKHRMGAAKSPPGVVASEIAKLEACRIECAPSDDLPPPQEPAARRPTTVPVAAPTVPVAAPTMPPPQEPPTRRPTTVPGAAKKAAPASRGNSLVGHR